MSWCPQSAGPSRPPTSLPLSITEWPFSLPLAALMSAGSGFVGSVRVEERTHTSAVPLSRAALRVQLLLSFVISDPFFFFLPEVPERSRRA